ncbi:MAG: hypothetical protein DRG78_01235 [Epsilonproteobacteria bacterium]|nr:MAG: hypothetical protein DRG78_01235 [Campylobacterota bacterium]
MEIGGKYYVSEENNKLSIAAYSYKEAKEILEQMDCDNNRHCIDCTDCNNCYDCQDCFGCAYCKTCWDCNSCQYLEHAEDLNNATPNYDMFDREIDYGKY